MATRSSMFSTRRWERTLFLLENYTVLQKLESKSYIERVKTSKDLGTKTSKGNAPISSKGKGTRGVDRVYFSITEKGMDEVKKATTYSSLSMMHGMMDRLQMEVAAQAYKIIFDELGSGINCGIAKMWMDTRLEDTLLSLAPADINWFFLEVGMNGVESEINSHRSYANISHMLAEATDIPLKNEYLDVIVAVMLLHDLDDWDPFLKEAALTLKPGGIMAVIDFATFNSYILEAMMQNFHKPQEAGHAMIGLDPKKVQEALAAHVKDVQICRMKEIMFVHGKK